MLDLIDNQYVYIFGNLPPISCHVKQKMRVSLQFASISDEPLWESLGYYTLHFHGNLWEKLLDGWETLSSSKQLIKKGIYREYRYHIGTIKVPLVP